MSAKVNLLLFSPLILYEALFAGARYEVHRWGEFLFHAG
jgi:hypothetical protein